MLISLVCFSVVTSSYDLKLDFSYKAEIKKEVIDILKFKKADSNSQYLDLPNCLGRNKSAIPGYLKERLDT